MGCFNRLLDNSHLGANMIVCPDGPTIGSPNLL